MLVGDCVARVISQLRDWMRKGFIVAALVVVSNTHVFGWSGGSTDCRMLVRVEGMLKLIGVLGVGSSVPGRT